MRTKFNHPPKYTWTVGTLAFQRRSTRSAAAHRNWRHESECELAIERLEIERLETGLTQYTLPLALNNPNSHCCASNLRHGSVLERHVHSVKSGFKNAWLGDASYNRGSAAAFAPLPWMSARQRVDLMPAVLTWKTRSSNTRATYLWSAL